MTSRSRLESVVSMVVSVHPHEIPALIHSSSCFFFLLSAYFVILPLRSHLTRTWTPPGTLRRVPNSDADPRPRLNPNLLAAEYIQRRALVYIHRFFSASLLVFLFLWYASSDGLMLSTSKYSVSRSSLPDNVKSSETKADHSVRDEWGSHGWFYVTVRIGFFLWVGLLNLITISSTWARVIDIMDNESGSRLLVHYLLQAWLCWCWCYSCSLLFHRRRSTKLRSV